MLIKINFLQKKLRSFALRVFSHIENNNGNFNPDTNGEKLLINNMFTYQKKYANSDKVILFDIGANVGDYTEQLLKQSFENNVKVEVHVFEPVSSCFNSLHTKYSGHSNVLLNKNAASNKQSSANIFYDQPGSTLASLHKRNLNLYSIDMAQSEMIETIRLDSYIIDKNIEHIHFLKVDVEGHEMTVLEGLGSYLVGDFIDFIQFEYGGTNLDSHTSLMELYELLEKSGFYVAKVMPRGLEIRTYQPWMDNFQYANYVAISKKIVEKLK